MTITITDTVTGASTTGTTTATVTAAPLTATGGFDLGALQQQSPTLTLAMFTSDNPNLTASDFTATIDWGDGSGALPAMVGDSGDGVFGVSGSHAYTQDGTYTATITITGTDGATANTTSTVTVGDVYAGIQSNLTVASFTDADTSVPASSFTATIDWGDGNQSTGTVTGGNGTFTVQGIHTYAQDSIDQPGGVYPVMVTVNDASGDTLTANSTVMVVRPPMAGNADEVVGEPGAALNNVQVAEFTVPDTADGVGEFSATVDWGDGSSSAGTIQEVTPGLFEVFGGHTYAAPGDFAVGVTVSQNWIYPAPAMMFLATAAIGLDQKAKIGGPSVALGGDWEDYSVLIPKLTRGVAIPSFTVSNEALAKIVSEGHYTTKVNGKTYTAMWAKVEFKNKSGVVKIELNGVVGRSVDVVQVKIDNSAVQNPPRQPGYTSFLSRFGVTIDTRQINEDGIRQHYRDELNAVIKDPDAKAQDVKNVLKKFGFVTDFVQLTLISPNPAKDLPHVHFGWVRDVTEYKFSVTYADGTTATLTPTGKGPWLDAVRADGTPYLTNSSREKTLGANGATRLVVALDAPGFGFPPQTSQGSPWKTTSGAAKWVDHLVGYTDKGPTSPLLASYVVYGVAPWGIVLDGEPDGNLWKMSKTGEFLLPKGGVVDQTNLPEIAALVKTFSIASPKWQQVIGAATWKFTPPS